MGFPVPLLNQRRSGIPGLIKANARALYHTKAGGISGSLLLDQSPLNSGTRRTGEEGRCYTGDGTDDYVATGTSGTSVNGKPASIMAWVKISSSRVAFSYPFGAWDSSANRIFCIMTGATANQIWVAYDNATPFNFTFAGLEDSWHHVAATFDGVNLNLYIDGVLRNQVADTEIANTSFDAAFLGRNNGANVCQCGIFDVRYYADPLTQDNINYVYTFGQSGVDPTNSSLLAQYKCDEQSGTTAYDSSGNGNNGTLTNITAGTFHATQDIWSFQNQVGYNRYYQPAKQVFTAAQAANIKQISFKFRSTDIGLILFNDGSGTPYLLVASSSDGSPTIYQNVGTPVIEIDGQVYAGANRIDLYNAICDGEVHEIVISGISFSSGWLTGGVYINSYAGWEWNSTTYLWDLVATDSNGDPIIPADPDVYLPRDESDPPNDVLGSPLTNTGRRPNDAALHSSNCLTADGALYIAAAHLVGTETVVSSGGTSTPSISAGRIDFTAGTCWDLTLSDGTHYPLSEGGGIGIHDDSGSGNHGILTNAVLANAWGGSQDSYHKNLSDGFVYAYQPAKQVFTGAQAANITGISFKFRSTDTNLIIFSDNTPSLYLIFCYLGSSSVSWRNGISGMTLAIDGSTEWGTTLGDLYNALCDGGIHEVVLTNLSFILTWVTDGIFINRYTGSQRWDSSTYLWDLAATDSNGDPIYPADPDVRLPAVTSSLGPYSIPLTDLPSDATRNRAETLIDFDPDSTPEMGATQLGIAVPASHAFGDAFAASDQIFSRQRTLTEDRFVVMPEAQTGSALATIQKYTQP